MSTLAPTLREGERWVSCARDSDYVTSRSRHVLTAGGVNTACGATGLGEGVWRGNTRKPPCAACVKARTPQRVQRTRGAGGGIPDGAVYVGRPTRWGNPFRVEKVPNWPTWAGANPRRVVTDGSEGVKEWPIPDARKAVVFESRAHANAWHQARATTYAVDLFALHTGPMGSYEYGPDDLAALRADLGGRDLACWCPIGTPCHADILLDLANPTQENP